MASEANERVAPLMAALKVAIEALEFYRNENNWLKSHELPCSAIIADTGSRAKKAIAEIDRIAHDEVLAEYRKLVGE